MEGVNFGISVPGLDLVRPSQPQKPENQKFAPKAILTSGKDD